MPWLVRDGEVLATVEVAASRAERRRGLLGRDHIEGGFVIRPCRQVHTFGMRVPIDALFCDGEGRLLRVVHLPPRRVSRPVLRSRFVVEAAGGAADRWRVRPGDVLELHGDA